jgi:hypothetical protein
MGWDELKSGFGDHDRMSWAVVKATGRPDSAQGQTSRAQ